ncbi:(2Fe-2S) ferredoxin [Formivibrio citricus]|uniref:(2Fe-2S) ferredoxin n=1 Tax=Formivibrio citricus TaxID=83765 RepID=A0A1I4V7J4_9NEIS|nr:(2Fe-2S) ferredoxin domain-containing protein [Formivibrio citricus]SFM97125.1 (2Fe-2S) ferredoxin [Formivibrio citricus]
MSYFKHHVFFCLNQRGAGESCCNNLGATELFEYAKERIRILKLGIPGKVRINKAGCLGRCDKGPLLVIYPEGVWYSYTNQNDIDQIIDEHIIGGWIVERLKI